MGIKAPWETIPFSLGACFGEDAVQSRFLITCDFGLNLLHLSDPNTGN